MSFGSPVIDHYPAGSYAVSLENIINEMTELVKQGHSIKWGPKEKWCVVNGKTFNIAKSVWEANAVSLH